MLLYIDGFDHYGASNTNFNTVNSGAYDNVPADDDLKIFTMPTLGGLGIRMSNDSNNSKPTGMLTRALSAYGTGDTLGVGCHTYIDTLYNGGANETGLFVIYDTSGATPVLTLNVSNGGLLTAKRGGLTGTSLGTSGANVLSEDTLYHIEMKVLFHASAGTVEVRVNGTPWIQLTGQNTLGSSAPSAVGLFPVNTGSFGSETWTIYADNLYIWDGSGTSNNNFLGERLVYSLYPNADDTDADWTLSSGTDGFDLINDVPSVTTDYITSGTSTDKSTFELTNLASTGISIIGVQTVIHASKDAAGSGSVEFGVTTNSVEDLSASTDLTQTQFQYETFISEKNPDTTNDWTGSEINALQFTIVRS